MSKSSMPSLIMIPLAICIGLYFNGVYENQTVLLCGVVSFFSISAYLAKPHFRKIVKKWMKL